MAGESTPAPASSEAPAPVDRGEVVREAAGSLVHNDNMPVEHVAQSVVEDMTKK